MCRAILEMSCTVQATPSPHSPLPPSPKFPSSKDNSANSKLHRDWIINASFPLTALTSCLVYGSELFISVHSLSTRIQH